MIWERIDQLRKPFFDDSHPRKSKASEALNFAFATGLMTGKKRMILESSGKSGSTTKSSDIIGRNSGKSGSTTKSSDITGRNSGKSGSTVRENYFEDYFHLEDYLLLLGGDHGR